MSAARSFVLAHIFLALPLGAWAVSQGQVWIGCYLAVVWVVACIWWAEYGMNR